MSSYIPEWQRADSPTRELTEAAARAYFKRHSPLGDVRFYLAVCESMPARWREELEKIEYRMSSKITTVDKGHLRAVMLAYFGEQEEQTRAKAAAEYEQLLAALPTHPYRISYRPHKAKKGHPAMSHEVFEWSLVDDSGREVIAAFHTRRGAEAEMISRATREVVITEDTAATSRPVTTENQIQAEAESQPAREQPAVTPLATSRAEPRPRKTTTVDWAAAGRKAWETRQRNLAAKRAAEEAAA